MNIKWALAGFLIVCLSFGAFAQATSTKMTPIQYNDQMADITDSLYKMGQRWGTKFNEIYNGNKDFSGLGTLRKEMNSFIQVTVEKIRRQSPVGKGAEGLQAAVIRFLTFENTMVTNAFGRIETLNGSSSDEEIQAAIKNLTDLAAEEEDVLKKVNAAQEDFGSKNGFSIEAPTGQEEE